MRMLAHRPRAVAFDVIQTLFSLESLRPRLSELGFSGHALEWWFASLLRDAFALVAAGDHPSFRALAHDALAEVAASEELPLTQGDASMVLDGLSELEAHPDVAPALEVLAEAGVPVMALSNGSAQSVGALFDRTGLSGFVSRIVSVEEAGSWKPRRELYRFAARTAGVDPGALALVAVHPWDVHGAGRAGLTSGLVRRSERPFPKSSCFPHVEGPSLGVVVERLLALPDR